MTSPSIKNIVVVGGGTAGWLSACILAKQLNTSESPEITITLIESPDIPIIGVGEGTVPTMRQTLKLIGISETDFIRSCSATFKQSIEFVDWLYNPAEKQHRYYHLFNYPQFPGFDTTPYWLLNNSKTSTSYADYVSVQAGICRQGRAPKKITQREFECSTEYAYHLDAQKFAQLLAHHGTTQLGIRHIKEHVVDVLCDESGYITALALPEERRLTGDFFVDCSGFNSLLLGTKLNVPFVSKKDQLFVDQAIAMQVPYPDIDTPIASATIATAKPAGWIWDIGLQTRRGVGYVYSSQHTSHDEAERVLREYVGDAAKAMSARRIPMRVGYREVFWRHNCVAIGLSAGFVEPLEATAILLIEATAKLVAELFPANRDAMAGSAKQLNAIARYAWDRVFDFVKLHYCISRRTDNEFWLDNCNSQSWSQSLQDKLKRWQHHAPTQADFPSLYEVFRLENHQYVLYGMEFKTDLSHSSQRYRRVDELALHQEKICLSSQKLVQSLPSHRTLIDQIHAHGLSAI